MTPSASLVAVCIGRKKPTRSAVLMSLSGSFVRVTSTHTTSAPASRSHAAGDASPNGWRPRS